jgi:hypothetical protein
MTTDKDRTVSHAEWEAEAIRRFGADPLNWRFVCPSCGHVASVKDWKDSGAPQGAVAFSCVGRYGSHAKQIFDKTQGPCNYSGGGLFKLNPVTVVFEDGENMQTFEFEGA